MYAMLSANVQRPSPLLKRLECFSNWFHAKRAIAVCLRLQHKFKGIRNRDTIVSQSKYVPVTVAEIAESEKEIIRQVQVEAFQSEINMLNGNNEDSVFSKDKRRGKVVARTSSLYKLDPFIDRDGIMRVGGRLRQANVQDILKHPAILPKQSHITDLIICHHHERVSHQGRGITLNEIKSCGY